MPGNPTPRLGFAMYLPNDVDDWRSAYNGLAMAVDGRIYEWRGAWSAATSYATNDAVSYNGSSYVATAANTNSAPPSSNWAPIAAAGAQGPTGPAGATGPQGPQGSIVIGRAYRAAALNTGTNTWTRVPMDTSVYDTGGVVSIGNGRLQAPVAGYYQVNGQVGQAVTAASDLAIAGIFVNGVEALRGNRIPTGVTGEFDLQVSGVVRLNANDYVELYLYTAVADTVATGSSGQLCRLDMSLINGGATGLQGPQGPGGWALTPVAGSSPYSALAGQYVNIATGNVTTPTAAFGAVFGVYNTGTGLVTIQAKTGNIMAPGFWGTSYPLVGSGSRAVFECDGTNWIAVADSSTSLQLMNGALARKVQWGYTSIAFGVTGSTPAFATVPLPTAWTTEHSAFVANVWPQSTWANVSAAFAEPGGLTGGTVGVLNGTAQNFNVNWISIGY